MRVSRSGLAIANTLILLIDYSQPGLSHDGSELVVGHVDGTLTIVEKIGINEGADAEANR